jgi:hypothetical protein
MPCAAAGSSSAADSYEVCWFRLDAFLLALADGWRFPHDIAQPAQEHHGYWSCLLERR